MRFLLLTLFAAVCSAQDIPAPAVPKIPPHLQLDEDLARKFSARPSPSPRFDSDPRIMRLNERPGRGAGTCAHIRIVEPPSDKPRIDPRIAVPLAPKRSRMPLIEPPPACPIAAR